MHIALNSINITPNTVGGGETYCLGLLNALSKMPIQHHITVLAHPDASTSSTHANITFQTLRDTKNRRRLIRLFNAFDSTTRIPTLLQHANIYAPYDIMHWVNGKMRPDMFNRRALRVLTFLDAQHIVFPEFFTAQELRTRAYIWADSIKRSDHIIAISHFAKQQLIEHYGVQPDNISVIHLGVDQDKFHRPLDAHTASQIRDTYQLPERFLYYPAGTWEHKNHSRLLAALALLIARGHDDIHLVLSGVQRSSHDHILHEVHQQSLEHHVKHIGFAHWEDVHALYQLANGVIFPSLFEGFGLPVIEAITSGTPVASSNISVLQEIGGQVVQYFDPYDIEAIADAILQLWRSDKPALHDTLVQHASQYNWANNAQQTLAVYERM